MAETVLNMARSMLGSAVSKAASIAADEMSLMLGVRKEIWFIKDELKTIQAFLMAAEMMEKKDLLLKEWVEQVRDLSYDIEDCLDEFMVHVGSQSLLQRLMKLKDRHRIADQIRSLKSRVEEVSNRNTRYRLIKEDLPSTSCDMDSFVEDIRNLSGCILASKKIEDWGNFYKELHSELEINPSLEALRRIVTLSYNHLPSHLKPCFLYLSLFPENFGI
ncbi:hypothetical protein SETIT_4G126600v2 [Setaria italica]|uniref:Disease resistance N-terminal domain-containing protein n=1 Tax=Setaria italica TaxID=4555 RepID=A0A368QU32_SETIT|nr:hypothetical protein SETIT_4G126600v2 [Setaria italica]